MNESKSKEWKKNRPIRLTKFGGSYGLKSGEMIRSLNDFNKPTFSETNEDVKSALDWTRYYTELGEVSKSAYKFEKHEGFGRDYPGSPMIDDGFKLSDGELEALLLFKSRKPFKASKIDYLDMIQELFLDLAKVQGSKAPAVMHTGIWEAQRGTTSFYTPHVVVLTGAKSVITALHEYTHSLGYGEVMAVRWSTNAFRIIFPKSFDKLESHPDQPHLLRRKRPPETEEAVEETAPACTDTCAIDLES